jgi:cytochrome d ubiquinol oxidase subunit I
MTDLLAARSQMALSLAFHIVFAIVGMGMPLLMVIAEGLWLRTRDETYLVLAQRWSKGTAIMFAVGAVSGTVLSFELGLLWPEFMAFAGPIVGMPFSLEGFAFFFEAIFLGIYLYGWDRTPPLLHWLSGVGVWLSGMASGIFVVAANAWMNSPQGWGIDETTGELWVDPVAAMFNDAMPTEAMHMSTAAIVSMAFAASGIHAWYLLHDRTSRFHQHALRVTLPVAIVSAVLQFVTGHAAAEYVAEAQPIKLAAAEAHWHTEAYAPLVLGGWPDEANETTRFGLEVPGALSLLAFGDPSAEVRGLTAFPRDEWPPVLVVHLAYQVMLGLGMLMLLTGLTGLVLWLRAGTLPLQRWYLRLLVLCGPAGLIAVEAGWTVTEVGRQPWVIRGVMRTADAVTPVGGLTFSLGLYALVYAVLGALVVALLRRQLLHAPDLGHDPVPEEVR